MDREQLNLKILMKKFLSDEKEYIKFLNKGNKDIIVFEKHNFYIYSDVLCGIESRKKEKYNIGDIYLFLCLPKSNYTYSYINSIGYKYISILERGKIIKIIEEDEDSDEIRVNFFIYDEKKKIDLHDYVDIEKEHIIKVELFNSENSEDIEEGSEDNMEKKDIKKNEKIKIIKKEDSYVLNKDNIENNQEKISSEMNKENNKSSEDNLISFENTRKICDSDKILESLIFYFKSDYISNSLNKYKLKSKSLRRKRKYNFLEDTSLMEYDELIYYNINEINSFEEYDNELSSNFEFFRRKCSLDKSLYNNSELYNKRVENFEKKDEIPNNKYYYKNNENQKNNDSVEKNYSILRHYYENNFFQNIFFQNLNLYSLLKNIYIRRFSNEEIIDKNVKLISEKFHIEYMKYIQNNHKFNPSNCNHSLSENINDYVDINDECIINNSLIEKDIFEFDWNSYDTNEENKNSINKYKKLDYNNILYSFKKRRKEFFNEKKFVEIMKNFNEHDKIIFFHNLLTQYIYSLNNKKYYEQNKGNINFVHNFISNLSHEEDFNVDTENFLFSSSYIPFTDSDELSFKLNEQEKYNKNKKCEDIEKENNGGNNVNSNDENDPMLRSFSENSNVSIDSNNNLKCNIGNFNLLQNNYVEIKNSLNINLSNLKLSDTNIKNNKELIKSTHIKEINFKGPYDIIEKNDCDFSRIYKFFEEELLKKGNIKNVYINGIKKNIIVDDNSKITTQKKSLKVIDEIHLKYKKRPIILIPKDNNIINKNNIESFFLHNNLNSTNLPMQSNSTSGIYDSLSIIYKMFNKSIKFLFIENDKISKFTEIDWKCVIAVILNPNQSLKELLKEYPFQSLTDLFHTFKTFVFIYTNEKLSHDLLSYNNIEIIKLNHNNRKDDYISVNKFWSIVEKFILQRRDKNFFFKKKFLAN
ncbi:conserved Plasmodium protein, unknown function [Plasmodium relictum]|uniref:Cell division control protein 73 C-terminal domain-containing protein n=1 Tax=Plasmodium relictum TaxID=85471 RepID=A0A1J1H6C6_PLARL|nr:conserved Plasmodium protein, unknown function [Plasmodium relictum]CRH00457.1 conserved Plasmodium protein, unknown function [Plasmodium relictum]